MVLASLSQISHPRPFQYLNIKMRFHLTDSGIVFGAEAETEAVVAANEAIVKTIAPPAQAPSCPELPAPLTTTTRQATIPLASHPHADVTNSSVFAIRLAVQLN